MSDTASAADRILEHLRVQAIRRALEVVPGPPGLTAVFDADWPVSHLSNRVLVTGDLDPGTGTDEVLDFVDAVFAGRDMDHRKVDALDDRVGQNLGPGLLSAGYSADPVLIMVAGPAGPPLPVGDVPVEIVDEAVVSRLVEQGWRLEVPTFTDETVRQLVGRRAALDRAGDVTRLAVRDAESGTVVAKADLLVIDDVAEIDDVLTLPDHRGRGYASALVRAAIARASELGAALVYLEAAEEDWPQHLYSRLGFTTVTTVHEHTLLSTLTPAGG